MEFVELPAFTKRVGEMVADDEYARLQITLAERPEGGAVIRGSGGIRKLRWAASGRGKRGGMRVIYYWWVRADQILLLNLYPKSEKEDMTKEEIKKLKQLVEKHLSP